MPRPKIGALYAVWPSRLNVTLASPAKGQIPVRVLSGTAWMLPKSGQTLQPHQACPAARFRLPANRDRDWNVYEGILVCWAVGDQRKPGDPGPHAATGEDALQRLRALPAPNLRQYSDYLRGALRDARMEVDVLPADALTDLIPEEAKSDEKPAAPRIKAAIPPTRPVFSHLETEWLMEIIMRSGHERADYLVDKLVEGADRPETYAKLLDRVCRHVQLTVEN